MVELVLCIVACSLLVIGFKIFDKLKVSSLQAIVMNYGVAGFIGAITEPQTITIFTKVNEWWFINGCVLGAVFMINFYVMSLSTVKIGASVTSVASKMSLVITVIFGFIYFGEPATIVKIIGIFLALVSVFLIVQLNADKIDKRFVLLPIILFLGGGFIDISLNFNQVVHLKNGGSGLFSTVVFTAAFLTGCIFLGFQIVKKREKLALKNIIAGIILGIVNWFSIYFLLLTLKDPRWDSSTVYTIVNIGILLMVVLTGVMVFREVLNRKQWLGVLLAFIAIILITVV